MNNAGADDDKMDKLTKMREKKAKIHSDSWCCSPDTVKITEMLTFLPLIVRKIEFFNLIFNCRVVNWRDISFIVHTVNRTSTWFVRSAVALELACKSKKSMSLTNAQALPSS